MKLLILGGTRFLGKHIVESALRRGHEVTLFNRGQSGAELFPEVEKLRGDRDGDLKALEGRRWDAAIDPSGYIPRLVRDSARLLSSAVDHYTFISSVSVFSRFDQDGMDENGPLGTLEDPTVEKVDGQTYGPLKVLCERAAEEEMPGRVLTVRPGLIVGPDDPTDRFTYWPHRVARGGEVLAPGLPEAPVQFIDVRDLAEWTVKMVEQRQTGIYNAIGPAERLSMGQFLQTCKGVLRSDASFTWVSEEFLAGHQVRPWMELPLWIPSTGPRGMQTISAAKAFAAGLTCRPVEETVRDTEAWARLRPTDRQWRAGMLHDREAGVLRAWHSRT